MINFNNGRCVTPRPSRRRLQHILALILLLALNLVSVDAQTNLGTIRGIVRDQTGTQLGNATITIIHKEILPGSCISIPTRRADQPGDSNAFLSQGFCRTWQS